MRFLLKKCSSHLNYKGRLWNRFTQCSWMLYKRKGVGGFTLLPNRYTPAPNFYRKNGFLMVKYKLFMYSSLGIFPGGNLTIDFHNVYNLI